MALDRDSIVRRDFPTNRRGYDPAAVEEHLTALAAEVDSLKRRAAEPASLSEKAGEDREAAKSHGRRIGCVPKSQLRRR